MHLDTSDVYEYLIQFIVKSHTKTQQKTKRNIHIYTHTDNLKKMYNE